MKKITFFSLFSLILCFSVLIFPNFANAEIANTTITINCLVNNNGSETDASGSYYNPTTRVFVADYSAFSNDGYIKIVAEASSGNLAYEWLIGGAVVETTNNIVISKKLQLNNSLIITVGETKITLKITNPTTQATQSYLFSIRITDSSSLANMQVVSSAIPNSINSTSNDINFVAKIPTTYTQTISWYIKKPADTSFNFIQNSESYTFSPANIINGNNGYGTYKIMAIGKTKDSNYYSDIYSLNATQEILTCGPGAIKIKGAEIKNSKADIQAFNYYLESSSINLETLNFNNIYWYINNQKVACGFNFIYEPTTTDLYKVSVKYDNGITSISLVEPLASLDQTPKTTGTYKLLIAIGAGVLILGVILIVSIKISNKKRDVVW